MFHPLISRLSFIPPIGLPEVIMIFLTLTILVMAVAVPLVVVLFLTRRKSHDIPFQANTLPPITPPPLPPTGGPQERLQNQEAFKEQNLISEEEDFSKRDKNSEDT